MKDASAQNNFKLKLGDKMRIIYDNIPQQKKRSNQSNEHYVIDSVNCNSYMDSYYNCQKLVNDSSDQF